ncbi:MAG: DUF5916 domain-containing protein [Ignavibacteria bacterium]
MKPFAFLLPFLIVMFLSESFAYLNNDSLQIIDTTVLQDSLAESLLLLPDSVDYSKYKYVVQKLENADIEIDGVLNESVWKQLPPIKGFFEIYPRSNVKPQVQTQAMMFYDSDNLYIGFICYDNKMQEIRSTINERDNIFSDDIVGISIDPYREGKQAFEFFVNPEGIQGDLLWYSSGKEDETYDAVWYSAAYKLYDRWTVEIKIPFKSLRFPSRENQIWNFHIFRIRPRQSREQISWVPILRDDPTLYHHSATLTGIQKVRSGKNVEIIPFVVGSQLGKLSDETLASSEFKNEKIKGQIGINIKYGFTSNFTVDLTFNPDFSQVEADAGVIDVNNTYAIFYTEKRPFFIEGNYIFATPFNIVYTRSINNPLYAFKVTGKFGDYEIGFISAYDKKTPFILPFEEFSDYLLTVRQSFANVFRVKKSLWKDSYIGLILTDREVRSENKTLFDIDGMNRVYGLDGKVRFLKHYAFQFQIVNADTKEITSTEYERKGFWESKTIQLDGEKFTGLAFGIKFLRSAELWNFSLSYDDVSPNARADLGFVSRNNYRTLSTYQSLSFYPKMSIINRIEPSIFGFIRHNFRGQLKEEFANLSCDVEFKKQITLNSHVFLVNNEDVGGVFNQGVRRVGISVSSNTFKFLRGGFSFEVGKYIIRNTPSYIGFGYNLEIWNTLIAKNNLFVENSYNYFELAKTYRGEKLYAGYLWRVKSTYYFNDKFSVRVIIQYDSFNKQIIIDPLVSYKINPFSVFYAGSSYEYLNVPINNGNGNNFQYQLSSRQIFLKIQYLWRI